MKANVDKITDNFFNTWKFTGLKTTGQYDIFHLMESEQEVLRQEGCLVERVPMFFTQLQGNLADAQVVFKQKRNGIPQESISINYQETFGWQSGDPRIAALNLIAKHTNSPATIKRLVEFYSQNCNTREYTTIEHVLLEPILDKKETPEDELTFRERLRKYISGTTGETITKKLLTSMGMNLFELLTTLGGDGSCNYDEQQKRVDAITALDHYFTGFSHYPLTAAIQMYNPEKWKVEGSRMKFVGDEAEKTKIDTVANNAFNQAEILLLDLIGKINATYIVKYHATTNQLRDWFDAEVQAGLGFLENAHKLQAFTPSSRANVLIRNSRVFLSPAANFVDVDGGLIKCEYADYADVNNSFSAWEPLTLVLIDYSETRFNTGVIKCPAPKYFAIRR